MALLDPFEPEFVRGVCDVLAQTEFPDLTGCEIDGLLQMVNGDERDPARTSGMGSILPCSTPSFVSRRATQSPRF